MRGTRQPPPQARSAAPLSCPGRSLGHIRPGPASRHKQGSRRRPGLQPRIAGDAGKPSATGRPRSKGQSGFQRWWVGVSRWTRRDMDFVAACSEEELFHASEPDDCLSGEASRTPSVSDGWFDPLRVASLSSPELPATPSLAASLQAADALFGEEQGPGKDRASGLFRSAPTSSRAARFPSSTCTRSTPRSVSAFGLLRVAGS
jgi:hypothetical protein